MALLNWSNAFAQAGEGLAAVGFEGVRNALEQEKIRLADELATVREEKGDNRRFEQQKELEGQRQQHAERLQDRAFGHAEGMQGRLFKHDKGMLEARQQFQREQDELNRSLTREQIQSNERIARENRQNAMAIARMGGSVTTDKEGNVLWVDRDGKAKAIDDPNNAGQPLKANKDLTPAAKAYADVLRDRLKALDANQAMSPEDKQSASVVLNEQLLKVLTGGIGSAGSPSRATGGAPTKGTVVGGYEFQGGNPNDRANWKQITAGDEKPKGLINKTTTDDSEYGRLPADTRARVEKQERIGRLEAALRVGNLPAAEKDRFETELAQLRGELAG